MRRLRLWLTGAVLAAVLLLVAVVVFVGTDTVITDARLNDCRVVLYEDRSWVPTNWHEADGFPPKNCRLTVVRVVVK